jgi:hypothetical protein
MTDRRGAIAAELEKGLAETVSFFKSLSPDELRAQVYQDVAQWTVQQVLAHFIAIERSMQWRFKDLLAGGRARHRISTWTGSTLMGSQKVPPTCHFELSEKSFGGNALKTRDFSRWSKWQIHSARLLRIHQPHPDPEIQRDSV